ncbi:uncharacterized protein LOC102621011 isoform X4 [Citrus sinensis]|uniref:uncharacterized protein LOC102621011 isoform X4 n=1 Tax=Citrus sinensis TaxID=2711 RepID=UPI0022783BC9|nr:uncharacterized protein LOC102621011 isoform X4 [Citrus sinensis]
MALLLPGKVDLGSARRCFTMRTSVLRMQFCEFKFFVTSCLIEPRQKKFVEGKVRMLNNSRRSNSVRTVSQGTIPVLASSNGSATSTRKDYSSVREPSTVFEEENPNGDSTDTPIVGIIMESDSDLPVMNDAARTLSDFGVPYEIKILSPHQNRKGALSYALSAKERGIKIIIVGDGVEAHLSGVAAANSQILVIRVPLLSEDWSEDDVINSIRMPSHVQVASVPRNNAKNAALYAVKVLGIADEDLLERIRKYVEE